jgi:hypothetical protein
MLTELEQQVLDLGHELLEEYHATLADLEITGDAPEIAVLNESPGQRSSELRIYFRRGRNIGPLPKAMYCRGLLAARRGPRGRGAWRVMRRSRNGSGR